MCWRGPSVLTTLVLCLATFASAQPQLPAGFTDTLVANVAAPTALAFLPGGRMLITTQSGAVRVFEADSLLSTPALTLGTSRVCSNSERGLLGIAVDPAFTENGFVYLFYTFRNGGDCGTRSTESPWNRVSRFSMAGNSIDIDSEVVLVDQIWSYGGNHNAGDLHFGNDGYLYVSTGDGGTDYGGSGSAGSNDAARERHHLLGKILRITRDGTVPPDNPYSGAGTASCRNGPIASGQICQEIFAWGLRNPFRIAFDPKSAGTRFYINDVGQNVWEEIDVGQAGADYGWNLREGFCVTGSTSQCPPASPTPAGITEPLFAYRRTAPVPGTQTSSCGSITGGAFVPDGIWPSEYDGAYLFSDYVCGSIFTLTSTGASFTASDFARNLGNSSAVHLRFGPFGSTQALYYTTYAGGGQIRRITHATTANLPPTAVISANPTSGDTPLTVTFDGTGSADPNPGDSLTYIWNFGDASAELATSNQSVQHTYTVSGRYTATLRVRDSFGALSAPASVEIAAGNLPPQISITSPFLGQTYSVGETVTLSGIATDPEQGALPASAITWRVILHHATHTHPFLGPLTGNNLTFETPAPEDLLAATNSYLEVVASAQDAGGSSAQASRDLLPRKVNLSFRTEPAGLTLLINNTPILDGSNVVSWVDYVLALNVPAQNLNGQNYDFESWADGAPRNRMILTPSSQALFTARFRNVTNGGGLTTVSAGSFQEGPLARGSIVSGFGRNFASADVDAGGLPLPTSLDGLSLRVRDASGASRLSPLFFASPTQVNFFLDDETATGPATLELLRNNIVVANESVEIADAAPSIFTVSQDGKGVPAAESVLVREDGSQEVRPAFSCSGDPEVCAPAVIEMGVPDDSVFLTLYTTGIRNRPAGTKVRVIIGGIECEVTYAGPQNQFVGLDQVNVRLSQALRGIGRTQLLLILGEVTANTVDLRF